MPKVLITDANGFVGKPLCKALLAGGWEVRGTVRSTEGLVDDVEAWPIDTIGPQTDWQEVLAGVDHVIHLAGKVHDIKEKSQGSEEEYFQINALGTKKLAEGAVQYGIKRFIFVSTIKAMADSSPATEPLSERSGFHPVDAYGRSKLEAEKEIAKAAVGSGMEWVIFRLPLVYGPTVRANMLKLLDLVNKGFPLPLGLVKNKRSLLFVNNLVDVLITALTHPRAGREIMLVSDGQDLSTPELIRLIAKAMDKRTTLVPVPVFLLKCGGYLAGMLGKRSILPALNRLTGSLAIDNAHVKRALDWEPPYSIEQGIQEMVEWYKNR